MTFQNNYIHGFNNYKSIVKVKKGHKNLDKNGKLKIVKYLIR